MNKLFFLSFIFSLLPLFCTRAESLPPGVIVADSPDPQTVFLGSPSLLVLPDGTYLVSHDFFGHNAGSKLHTARIFASYDKGLSWKQLAHFKDSLWGSLFYHNHAVYHLGTNREYGEIILRKSTDGGHTWTEPRNQNSGILSTPEDGMFHTASVPIYQWGGRIWSSFEEYTGPDGKWSGLYFKSLVISAREDSDLLQAKNWIFSNRIPFRSEWLPGPRNGWLEGNVIAKPDGTLVNILRVNDDPPSPSQEDREHTGYAAGIPRFETAAFTEIRDPQTVTFNPEKNFFHFPGSQSKFTIRYDSQSKRYWSLVNKITNPILNYTNRNHPRAQRNVIMLTSSPDLLHWTEHCIVLRWGQGQVLTNRSNHGFQYIDWQFEGNDIIAVSRTGWGGFNIHNSNYITFHRIKNFRTLTMENSAPDLAPVE